MPQLPTNGRRQSIGELRTSHHTRLGLPRIAQYGCRRSRGWEGGTTSSHTPAIVAQLLPTPTRARVETRSDTARIETRRTRSQSIETSTSRNARALTFGTPRRMYRTCLPRIVERTGKAAPDFVRRHFWITLLTDLTDRPIGAECALCALCDARHSLVWHKRAGRRCRACCCALARLSSACVHTHIHTTYCKSLPIQQHHYRTTTPTYPTFRVVLVLP